MTALGLTELLAILVAILVPAAAFAAGWGGVRVSVRGLWREVAQLRERSHAHGNLLAVHQAKLDILYTPTSGDPRLKPQS